MEILPAKRTERKQALVIGRLVSDFLCPLFREMNEHFPLDIYLLELRDNPRRNEEISRSFRDRWNFSTALKTYSKADLIKSVISPAFFKSLLNKKPVEAMRYSLIHGKLKNKFDTVDVFNFQFLSYDALYFLQFVPPAKKVILSFWGSDLFHSDRNFDYQLQKTAAERADHIIVHTPEMKHVFLSKFGRHLKDKVSTFLIVNKPATLEQIVKASSSRISAIQEFRKKYGISDNKTIITIGHSAHALDYHAEIVEQLAQLPVEVKDDLFLLLPMTYGNEGNYTDEVETVCKNSGISYLIFREYMSFEDLIAMRFASEIMLRLSEFDAFSLSVCETLCAGNIVICGSWLSYGKLRVAGIYFLETESFGDLNELLLKVLSNKSDYLEKCKGNQDKIVDFFFHQDAPAKMAELFLSKN